MKNTMENTCPIPECRDSGYIPHHPQCPNRRRPSDAATCADNIEGDGPTDEERAANWRELHKLSRANRFRLMFKQPMRPDE